MDIVRRRKSSASKRRPGWAEAQWFEVCIKGLDGYTRRFDRRRRTQASAQKIADELIASKSYAAVWLVEVNRLGAKR